MKNLQSYFVKQALNRGRLVDSKHVLKGHSN